MKKKTKGFIAGAAGVGLLMSGTTLALWNDTGDVPDSTIKSGNLDVDAGEWSWKDISEDREDAGHPIDPLSAFRIIPGDTIEGTIGLDVALEGENMVAKLGADITDVAGDPLMDDVNIAVSVVDENGVSVAFGADDTLMLASEDNGNPMTLPTVGSTLDGIDDLVATVTVTFPDTGPTQGTTGAQQYVALGDAELQLNQVRSDAPGFN